MAGLVGLGKIAREQHLPARDKVGGIELAAVATGDAQAETAKNYAHIADMLSAEP